MTESGKSSAVNTSRRAASWPRVRLGDVAKTSSGGTPKRTSPSYYGGGIPWVKSGELGDSTVYETSETISKEGLENSSAKLFPKGTLCVALYGATVGKLGILGIEAATNQAVCGIFLPPEIDTRFAYRFIESKRRQLIESAKGGAQPNISQEIIRDLQIPLPPLPEQRRIVAEIEKQFTRLDAGIAALRRTQANLKRYRAAVLKAACEGRLVPTEAELANLEGRKSKIESGEERLARVLSERRQNWRNRGKYKEPATPDMTNLQPLPDGWAWSTVDQLCSLVTDGDHNPPKRHETGLPHLTAKNVRSWRLDATNCTYISAIDADRVLKRYDPLAGDLIVTCVGTVGRTAIVPPDFKFSPDRNLAAVRLVERGTSTRFLNFVLSSPSHQELIKSASGSTAQPHLYLGDLRAIAVPLPPLAEQKRIVAEVERRLSVVEELETVVNANLQRATRLRYSILQQALCVGLAA